MSKNGTEGVTILGVRISNVGGIVFAEIKPKRNATIIGGVNGSGKSSLLKTIAMTIGGGKLVPSMPIRKGQESGSSEVDLSGDPSRGIPPFTAKMTLTRKGEGFVRKLECITKEGYKAPSPQKMLDDLIGAVGFDPLSFMRSEPDKQLAVVRKLVGIDFTQLDSTYKRTYEQRTAVNAKAKEVKARMNAIVINETLPDEEVSVAGLMRDLAAAESFNKKCDKAKEDHKKLIARHDSFGKEIADIDDKIAKLQQQRSQLVTEQGIAAEQVLVGDKAIAELVYLDADSIKKQISDSDGLNAKIRKKQEKAKLEAEFKVHDAKADDLTKQIEQIDKTKEEMVSQAKWPIEGLGFGEFGVMYNSIPLDQACQAEAISVSVAIGAALNPSLKYMFLQDGSLLDDEMMLEVAEIGAKHGLQLFIERVGKGNECDIVFSDGVIERIDDECKAPEPVAVLQEVDENGDSLFPNE